MKLRYVYTYVNYRLEKWLYLPSEVNISIHIWVTTWIEVKIEEKDMEKENRIGRMILHV